MIRTKLFFFLACIGVFALPIVMLLASQAWRSEAGSLAPLVLILGAWTLWHAVQSNREVIVKGRLGLWMVAIVPATGAYLFASAISMPSLLAFAGWAALVATFYASFGPTMLRRCAIPLIFLGLVIPLPYTATASINAMLREWISDSSVDLAAILGMDVAQGHGTIMIEQYVLAVENACAGANSTFSLIAIGLLFSYWISSSGALKTGCIMIMAVPVAFLANILRVVFLLWLTSYFGSAILDTALHPLSGVISFVIASICLTALARMIGVSFFPSPDHSSPNQLNSDHANQPA